MTSVKRSLDDVSLGFVDTYSDVEDFMRWLGERRPVIACDTETAGLDPWASNGRVRLIQFGDAMTGWAIPWHKWPGLAHEVIQRYTGPMVFHNVAFDAKYMAVRCPELELPWSRIDDTMIMARMAQPLQSAALKSVTSKLFDSSADIGQKALHAAMETNGWDWDTVPMEFETYTVYSAMDVVLTARLWEYFQPWLAEGSNRANYELEMQVRKICTNMELKGARVDLDYCQTKYDQLSRYVEEQIQWARDAYKVEMGSPKQLVHWIESHGGTITSRTPKGFPSVDKAALTTLMVEPSTPAEVRLIAEQTLKARKAEKLAGTYFRNFIDSNHDGILHPDINPLAARTSRMSITKPALQTLNKGEATVRDAFIPHSENEVIVTCDSDQIESRLFANFSEDIDFQRAFDEGDFFVNIAKEVYNDPGFVKADKRRATIKTYWYSKLYGAGIPKMALSAKVPIAVMRDLDAGMNSRFPGIKRFQGTITSMAARDLRIVTPTGRELRIEDSSKAYVGVNYMLQGHAAECLKLSLVNADNSGLGEFMMLPVHDEIVCSVPRGIAYDVARTLEECMTHSDPDLYPVPLTASAEGPFERWGDKIRQDK